MKEKPMTKLESFPDLQGELTSRISEENSNYGVAVDELNKNLSILYIRLKEQGKMVSKILKDLSISCTAMGETANALKAQYDAFNEKVEFSKSAVNSSIFESLATCFNSWSKQVVDQAKVLNKYVVNSTRWSEFEVEAHNEVIEFGF
jgi:hypothetical protein